MAKKVSDLIVERLIEWGVDTIFGFPGDGIDGFFEALRTNKTRFDSCKCDMKKRRLSRQSVMRSTLAGSVCVAQPRDPAASIC